MRPAYHSSSYDYNLTAQLVTDGIKSEGLPQWIVVSEPHPGPVSKENREVIVDHAPMNTMELHGARAQVDIQLGGGDSVPEIDRIQIFVVSPSRHRPPAQIYDVYLEGWPHMDNGRESFRAEARFDRGVSAGFLPS